MNLLILSFKKWYIQLPCTVDEGEASILSQGNMSTKDRLIALWHISTSGYVAP